MSYSTSNTVNPSLGPLSPTKFRTGELEQRELNFNVDLPYPIEVGFAEPLNLAGGLEWRRATWGDTPGERPSYPVGPVAPVLDTDTPAPTDGVVLADGWCDLQRDGQSRAG